MSESVRVSQFRARAVTALVTTESLTAAATASGLSERTLRRYLAEPEFRQQYRAAAREQAQQAASAVLAASLKAVEVLAQCMDTGTPATKTRAARVVLDLALRIVDDDVAARLDLLEAEVRKWDQQPGLRIV
jgi:hypothetical protein